MFGDLWRPDSSRNAIDLDWPLNASRGLSAIAEFLVNFPNAALSSTTKLPVGFSAAGFYSLST